MVNEEIESHGSKKCFTVINIRVSHAAEQKSELEETVLKMYKAEISSTVLSATTVTEK